MLLSGKVPLNTYQLNRVLALELFNIEANF